METSEEIGRYFKTIQNSVDSCYKVANQARARGYDPETVVSIPLAKDMAERVEGLVSVVAPQLRGSILIQRIKELEKIYGSQDWRVALKIAVEVAQGKICDFKSKEEAMEVGVRVGFAYITVGVVASPLEGFLRLEIKKRRDGKEYVCAYYAGPVRSAGGTAEAVSLIIVDYVRKEMGYDIYDPTPEEIKRAYAEISHYHERVSNLQYFPSEEEIEFLTKNVPIQIDGDGSESVEVPNYRDLPRIKTNILRNGYCLVLAEGLSQKAQKMWKRMSSWVEEFGMGHWRFLEEFVRLQKQMRAQTRGDIKRDERVLPDNNYLKDLVAGRPILGYPMRKGGFRVRFGRTRVSGFSCDAISPITMFLLDNLVAVGTQLKVERPGKSTVISSCDSIEGPIVKLNDGSVVFVESIEQAKMLTKDITEIIFMGDILINYGDFLDRGHVLFPPGYCEEWWAAELERATGEDSSKFEEIFRAPQKYKPSCEDAINISKKYGVALHPRYTYHWADLKIEHILSLVDWLTHSSFDDNKIVLPLIYNFRKDISQIDPKRVLELLGVPHKVVSKENVVIEDDWADALRCSLGFFTSVFNPEFLVRKIEGLSLTGDALDFINQLSEVKIRDKSGVYLGSRMGRPEKGKMRKLTGSPHVLFPVGEEGGRLRSFQSALEKGKITGQFSTYICRACGTKTIYSICHKCDGKADRVYHCKICGEIFEKCAHEPVGFDLFELDIKDYFASSLKKLGLKSYPELIKGVRGTSNKGHIPENLCKGILRAVHGVHVNKDGTTRFDMTELPCTHFKAREVGVSIEKLRLLGYTKDIFGSELNDADQVVELKCQDVILPSCVGASEEGADVVLVRVCNFLDDLLTKFYGLDQFYNVKKKEDLIGHLVVGLSPHTSAGIIGRIVGFSSTQGLMAHPLFHSIMRRDCFGRDVMLPIFDGKRWQNVRIGEFVEELNLTRVVDSYGTRAKKVDGLYTLGYNKATNKVEKVKINDFTKHQKSEIFRIKTSDGREIEVTEMHKFIVYENGKFKRVMTNSLQKGDKLVVPFSNVLESINTKEIDLIDYYSKSENIVARGINKFVASLVKSGISLSQQQLKKIKQDVRRDSIPLSILFSLLDKHMMGLKDIPSCKISAKRDTVNLNPKIPLNNDVLNLLGLYAAEGYARKNTSKKGFYQIQFAASEEEIRDRIKGVVRKYFNLRPSLEDPNVITYSSRIFYEFIVEILKCGRNAHEKRIPSILLSMPEEKIASFLRGYFDGDGSVSLSDLRVTCDSISNGLLQDLEFVLSKFGLYTRRYIYTKKPGPAVRQFYIKKKRAIPSFTITKLIIPSDFCQRFYEKIGFSLTRKMKTLKQVLSVQKPRGTKIEHDKHYAYPEIISIEQIGEDYSYCLNVNGHIVVANNFLVGQCDGDESGVMMLMDALLNFSVKLLSSHRGATQDEPLVLTSTLIPSEVDDMVFNMDVCWRYPLEFYEACMQYKSPSEFKLETLRSRLGTPLQYEGYGFTHDVENFNTGVTCSSYKTIPTMGEKVMKQMGLAERSRSVDADDVARLIIERHFLRDIKGNLRKFSMQEFRCVSCNEKFRRPPLSGVCSKCGGKLLFTVTQGSITKYLEPSLMLAEKYSLPSYLKQTLELLQQRIDLLFGKETEKQEGLGKWLG